MADNKKCEHGPCDCVVSETAKYCSEYCEDAKKADVLEIRCGCEHPACS